MLLYYLIYLVIHCIYLTYPLNNLRFKFLGTSFSNYLGKWSYIYYTTILCYWKNITLYILLFAFQNFPVRFNCSLYTPAPRRLLLYLIQLWKLTLTQNISTYYYYTLYIILWSYPTRTRILLRRINCVIFRYGMHRVLTRGVNAITRESCALRSRLGPSAATLFD